MKNLIFLLILSALTFVGCGDDETPTVSTPSTTSYIGSTSGGSVGINALSSLGRSSSSEDINMYSITLSSAGTFVITTATGLEVNGTYTTLSSGFVKLTVTSASGDNAPEAGAIAYGLNVPGLIFFLAPVDGDGEIIPMVTSGVCPSSSQDFLWSMAGAKDGAQNALTNSCNGTSTFGLDIVGRATIDADTLTVSEKYDICNGVPTEGSSELGFSCDSGIGTVTNSGNLDALMYLTAGGGAIVKTSPGTDDEKTIVALSGEDSLAISDLDGNYAGIVFVENSGSGDSLYSVVATIADDKLVVSEWDVENNTASTDPEAIAATVHTFTSNTPTDGMIYGKLDIDSDQTDNSIYAFVTCQADKNANSSGKNVIVCVGQAPNDGGSTEITTAGDGSDDAFSLVLVQK